MGVCWVGGFKGGGEGSEGHGQGIGSSGNKVSKKFFLPASGLPTPLIPLRYSGAHCRQQFFPLTYVFKVEILNLK